MSTKIQVRRGTAAQWTAANPTLDSGEIGFETDTGKFKIGSDRNIIQTVVTGGTSVVYTTGVAHGLVALDYVTITGITTAQGLPASNPVQITAATNTTFTVAVTTGTTGTYTSLTGIATSPWNSSLYASDHSDFVGVLTGAKGGTGVNNAGHTITLGGNLTTSGAHTTTLTTTANTSVTLPTSGTLLSTAAVVTGAQGGTGVANTSKTITLGGNLTTSGAFDTTLTSTGTTAVTLPTAGTLVTLDGSEALTNKTLTSPVVTGGTLNGGAALTVNSTELNILDGVTSSAAELNILDGATLSTTELNYVNGVTSAIQTQLNAKAPLASPAFTGSPTVSSGRLGAVVGGVGTTTSGANLTVTHGLGVTPTSVVATVRANTYSAALNTNIFVSTPGATTFTVFANTGAGGAVAATFSWIAVA